ncbi:cytochrome C oxidase subunit IV family protein [Schlesneria sp. DSM 10557]|uniref:cytochrome C oxidase subunit IV family protein n=1 Tax=Schlesneria sp. DSM 10557 TaxID=3044399 RepID=UPI00359FFA31
MTEHEQHESHGGVYFKVFLALCVFTLISVAADLVGMPNKIMLGAIVLAVAVAKALCVLMYFMHLKFERAWKYLLLVPTTIIALAIPVSLRPDIGASYYVQDIPQLRDYPEHEAATQSSSHH